MPELAKQMYVFDDFCLDAAACQLKRQGELIPLPPKVFDVLLVMVENRGRILDKEFLHRTLWPDTFVEDGTLAQYVFLLRKALQEETAGHRYIETVPRRGYRFIASVQEINGTDAAANGYAHKQNAVKVFAEPKYENGAPSAAVPLPPPRHSNWLARLPSKWPLVFLSASLVLVTGIAYFLLKRPASISRHMQITKLTTLGKAALPALSPDAKYVAYVVDDAGKQSVWVRQLAAANNVQVIAPAEVDFMGLTFSPDGNYLYYLVYGRPQIYGTLYRMPVLGGTATKLIDDIDSPIAFSPDGNRVAFIRIEPLKSESYLVLANANGTEQQTLATRKRPDYFHASDGVAWSPDGKLLACAAGSTSTNGPFMNLIGVRLSDGQETVLTSQHWKQMGQMAWRKDGKGLMAMARSQDSPLSTTQLWYFPYPQGEALRITNDLNLYANLSPNHDLSKLVTIQSTRVSSLWVIAEAEAARAVQIGGATMDNYSHLLGLDWMPNGQLIYGSYASGNADLWQMDADGSKARQLTVDPKIDFSPAVSGLVAKSPFIAFVSSRGGGYGIWRMDADGQNVRRLTNGQADYYPNVTPDGKWVFYSTITSELPTTWKVAAEGGEPVPFLQQPAFHPAVSPDGKWVAIFYAIPEQLVFKLALVPIEGGEPQRIFEVFAQDLPIVRWSADGQMMTYVVTKDGISNLWGQPRDGSPAKPLTHFKADRIFRFAWSPDGKKLVCERGFYVNDVVLMSDVLPS